MAFAIHYVFALIAVGLMLLGLHVVARAYARHRQTDRGDGRIVIVESRPLSQHANVHIVQCGERRYFVASSQNSVMLLAVIED